MLLLDTNALYWALTGKPFLGPKALRLIDITPMKHFSSLSLLELELKRIDAILKNRRLFSLPQGLSQKCVDAGLYELPVVAEISGEISRFQALIGHDPFDRIILAQASKNGLRLLTSDRKLLSLGLDWVIDAQE